MDEPAAGNAEHPPETPYVAFIKEQYDAQEARKASLETRAGAVIAASGAAVTLLFALSSLVTKPDTFALPADAKWYLRAALIPFGLSAILATVAAAPLVYRRVPASTAKWLLDVAWEEPHGDASTRITAMRVKMLGWNQFVNGIKAVILSAAVIAQIVAIVLVALAVAEILKPS